jgi:hypothetical protein
LTPLERKTHFIRHNIDSLLRADPQARAESLRTQFLHATITPNEWRRLEGRNPSADPNADKLWIQANLMPLDTPPKPPPSAPEPPPVQPMTPDEMPDDVRRMIELGGLLSRDNAARVVRREVETVRKLAEREAADAEAWRTAVDQFYARHAAYIAELLHVSLDAARTYTADHRARLLADGVGALESWNGDAEQALIALALGRGKG